eukprot:TRINITY_DN11236_c0_g1_i1.p1 TRINITY_DN11236_c0_g1~~TRINITY_DN11236_c0_g1_i1.p1  ORF type:complete len:596 (+),score=82.19 TRINITY_DN11236_c0_g1_i1:96-1790(+)
MGRCARCCCKYCLFVYVPILTSMLVALVLRGVGHEWGSHGWGGAPRTLDEQLQVCPRGIMWFVENKLHPTVVAYQTAAQAMNKHVGEAGFHPSWADDFITIFWVTGVHGLVGSYKQRFADSVPLPGTSADPPSYRIGSVVASDRDIDSPLYFPIEKFIPRALWETMFVPIFCCYMQFLRDMPFEDDLNNSKNTWNDIVNIEGKYKRKEDWVMSYYDGRTQFDGTSPAYPAMENHLSQLFFKADQWDDALEKALAFDLIGPHRVQVVHREVGGETLPYMIALNDFADVPVRPHFGKYGADMYFTAEGMPALIVTPEAHVVHRGDKDWQYWKFVWRSTLASIVTFVDHLQLTHFRAANIISRSVRKSLPKDHIMRRFMSIWTFGSVFVNNMAMNTLLGSGHSLHRSTPFADYEALVQATPSRLPSILNLHQPFLNETVWEQMPEILKQTPYYADGKLLFTALRNLIAGSMQKTLAARLLTGNNGRMDKDYERFLMEVEKEDRENEYAQVVTSQYDGTEAMFQARIATVLSLLWTVTGWHRHVGTVGPAYVAEAARSMTYYIPAEAR